MVHMVDQIRALGPTYLHEMWAYEHFMATLNRYVLNCACPEGFMIEAYCTKEIVECYQDYLVDKKGIGVIASHHTGKLEGKGTRGRKTFVDRAYHKVASAHFSVLHQLEIMSPFIEPHLNIVRAESNSRSEAWVMKEHKQRFTTWLMDQNIEEGTTVEGVTLKRLALGPFAQVRTWQSYDINGYTFYTSTKDKKSVCQNSGVWIDAIDDTTGNKVIFWPYRGHMGA